MYASRSCQIIVLGRPRQKKVDRTKLLKAEAIESAGLSPQKRIIVLRRCRPQSDQGCDFRCQLTIPQNANMASWSSCSTISTETGRTESPGWIYAREAGLGTMNLTSDTTPRECGHHLWLLPTAIQCTMRKVWCSAIGGLFDRIKASREIQKGVS